MSKLKLLKAALAAGVCLGVAIPAAAYAREFNVPGGDLERALALYTAQAGVSLAVPSDAVKGVHTKGAKGDFSPEVALARILKGTGFAAQTDSAGVIRVMPQSRAPVMVAPQRTRTAEAAPAHAAGSVETVVVTSSKIKGDIQTVPIAITALSQEQLTSRQIAGGPDLVKEVPNLTFSKTNFSGYNIQIRGIGTQAISVTTDPAVAVALNDIPFIRNHFFEQEFFDVNQVEVLRGPQGTLYGRNATAGVVNVISAKPTDQFEAMLSADWGNYLNRRYEGMVNIPVVDDRLDIRAAAEWTKREGYTTNTVTGQQVDGRDLWSSRVTIAVKPMENLQTTLVWEHFSEKDDRMRTAKQLCKTDPGLNSIDGVPVDDAKTDALGQGLIWQFTNANLSQGCLPTSMYNKGDPAHGDYGAFGVPNGFMLPYVVAGYFSEFIRDHTDPYASTRQSTNLRDIETQIDPHYDAKNDTLELNADYNVTPALTVTSQTGYNQDFLWSTEDFNRFNTTDGIFLLPGGQITDAREASLIRPNGNYLCGNVISTNPACGAGTGRVMGDFCDPQLGCSSRLVVQDVSEEHAWQFSQEFRLASSFKGPFNFSVGGNYMHYETVEDYYVMSNMLTLLAADSATVGYGPWVPNVSDNHQCLSSAPTGGISGFRAPGHQYASLNGSSLPSETCYYIDPNDLNHLNGEGHNYFRSDNPYVLNSYAGFGEAYYNVRPDLKLTGGIRWTDDQKHFIDIPSELLVGGYGYASSGVVNQQWNQLTGRLAADWSPKLDFTDQTLIYGSFAHGYKAGGANPPGAVEFGYTPEAGRGVAVHPLTFKPEFIDAYELGSKNTLLDGGLTLNGDVFFYNYTGYQISKIVDRTAINDNFNATVKGAELEAMYEPLPGLKFNFAGGYEDARLKKDQYSIDLMDRTAGTPGWVVLRPFVTQSSNCILPEYVIATLLQAYPMTGEGDTETVGACGWAYNGHLDPYNDLPYDPSGHPARGSAFYPQPGYPGFDPNSVDPAAPAGVNEGLGLPPNNGEGFAKNIGGNQLPNAPHFTASLSGEYTIPVSEDWAATLHSDFYWQSQSFARVFNDRPYDKIRGYSTTNVALILTSASGWQVMGYVKNVFDVTAITGAFLNPDDTGLTTNVFLTDPRLYGLRITRNW